MVTRRPVIAVVTGFTKSGPLAQRSFAPLRSLKHSGAIQRILYVTWNRADIDAYVEPIAVMPDIECVRVQQPDIAGTRLKAGVTYQIRNLETALARIPESDALIVKLRPDFIIDEGFLRAKIDGFETVCARSETDKAFGVAMPPSPFAAKVWIPWADANLPFHYEDAAFIGLKCDIAKLADRSTERLLDSELLADEAYAWFAHVARYATVFSASYPLFDSYVRGFRFFANTAGHRMAVMPAALKEPFFWRLVVANAWILATHFHVDCGQPGDLTFYANSTNPHADWSALRSLEIHSPYNAVAAWRAVQHPGGMLPCVGRMHARLVDDSWQHALFSGSALSDLMPDNLRSALRHAAGYRRGIPDMAEQSLCRALDAVDRAIGGGNDLRSQAPNPPLF